MRDFGKWCLIGVLVFSTVFVAPFLKFQEADNRKTTQEKFDYINQNRPYLEAELVIESVDSNAVDYHFEIHNNGALPAILTLEEEKSPDFTAPDIPIHTNYLIPNGHMQIPSETAFINTQMPLDLYVEYKAFYEGTNLTFNDIFHFQLNGKIGRQYSESDYPESKQDPIRGPSSSFDGGLTLPSGAVSFFGKYNGTNQLLSTATNRLLVVDELSKTVLFKSSPNEEKSFVLDEEIPTNKAGFYMVVASWDTNHIMLCVNTNCKSAYFAPENK